MLLIRIKVILGNGSLTDIGYIYRGVLTESLEEHGSEQAEP